MVNWPDLTFPPINLYNVPYMKIRVEPKDTVETEKYKWFSHKECEFYPCHNVKEGQEQNCLMCYCPLAFLQCPGNYEVIESPIGVKRKDCSQCTLTHELGGWEVVQNCLKKPKYWNQK